MISDESVRLNILKNILADTNDNLSQNVIVSVESMDDAALIRISDEQSLVIASDFVRGSGFYLFELGYLNYFDVGYYLIAANVSDIAAMGAKPLGLTTVIRYAKSMTDEEFQQIFDGMKTAADCFSVKIVGGDIGGHSADVFAATAFGLVKNDLALLRKNVQDNDLLCVTGKIGIPITALTYFKEVKQQGFSLSPEEEEKILLSWKRPSPKIKEGLILSENKIANACQDVSDGLKATIEQISSISGKTFTINYEKLPIDETTQKMASFLGTDVLQIAISSSVDFELMFTMSPDKQDLCSQLFEQNGCTYSIIGKVNSLGKNVLINENGQPIDLPGVAWKQQTGDYLKEIISVANVE
jgi:thiamine-monophosphate kinase